MPLGSGWSQRQSQGKNRVSFLQVRVLTVFNGLQHLPVEASLPPPLQSHTPLLMSPWWEPCLVVLLVCSATSVTVLPNVSWFFFAFYNIFVNFHTYDVRIGHFKHGLQQQLFHYRSKTSGTSFSVQGQSGYSLQCIFSYI